MKADEATSSVVATIVGTICNHMWLGAGLVVLRGEPWQYQSLLWAGIGLKDRCLEEGEEARLDRGRSWDTILVRVASQWTPVTKALSVTNQSLNEMSPFWASPCLQVIRSNSNWPKCLLSAMPAVYFFLKGVTGGGGRVSLHPVQNLYSQFREDLNSLWGCLLAPHANSWPQLLDDAGEILMMVDHWD